MAFCPSCKGEFEASFCPRDGSRLITDEKMLADRYRLVRKVGEGAMGVVYEAIHVHLDRRVAVKLLQHKIAGNPEASARLQREARAMTGLGHPNVVDTIDFGFAADGQAFLVMEWLDGENLDARMARGLIDVATALDIATQTCAGVAAAHDRGVIHRDLKPANLFLTRDHRGGLLVKVLDFGIAKLALHETKLTATGVLIGTPNYMAPEQAEGHPIDARTDVYALGVIIYEMLTGTVPFVGETPLSVLHQHTSRMPVTPSARAPTRGITDRIDELVMRCLAKRPDDRFASMHELATALAQVGAPQIAQPAQVAAPPEPVQVASAPQKASVQVQRDEDAGEDDVLAGLPRRRRWVVPVVIGGLAVAAAVTALALGRRGAAPTRGDAAVATAAIDSGGSVILDAGEVRRDAVPVDVAGAVVADAAEAPREEKLSEPYSLRGHHISGTLRVRPALPVAGHEVELFVELGALEPRLQQAATSGKLQATVEVEYYKTDTLIAPPIVLPVDASGRFSVSVQLEHATKHHVHIDLLIDGKEVDHAKVDLWPELH